MNLTANRQLAEIAEGVQLRDASIEDIEALLSLEQRCFENDRLNRRSFRRHIQSPQSDLLVATDNQQILGYGLILRHPGTRLARLYSLALLPEARGLGLAQRLLSALEDEAEAHDRLYMRLEVAKNNEAAIRLYSACGYRAFGEYADYYQDHSDALRMQKTIRHLQPTGISRQTPWYQQTTEFTCGPASLMMAMASLSAEISCEQALELDLWREATTIFMTSGHGGCHPFGLALAAAQRGFSSSIWVNTDQPLFVEGVRSEQKKQVMELVHEQFLQACQQQNISIDYQNVSQLQLQQWLEAGYGVIILISTYRLDGRKAPHWVVVTGIDDSCLYVHDPDVDDKYQQPIDCQYVPIARSDFDKMSAFGAQRLRTAVVIKPLT